MIFKIRIIPKLKERISFTEEILSEDIIMIKYKTAWDYEGIHLIQKRFPCCISSKDEIFLRNPAEKYWNLFNKALIGTLVATIIVFQLSKKFEEKSRTIESAKINFIVQDIPVTKLNTPKEVPARPTIPIASEDEELPPDETIDFTDIDFAEVPPPPPPPTPSDDEVIFVAFDIPPQPVGGYAAILNNLVYPEVGRQAGVDGRVILHVKIDDKGNILRVKVAQSLLEPFDDAAIAAVKSVDWIPAKQRDLPVTVWMSVPITFRLKDEV